MASKIRSANRTRSYCELSPLDHVVHFHDWDAVTKQQRRRLATLYYFQGALVLHSRRANGSYPIPAYIPIPSFSELFCIHAQLLSGNYQEEHN
jgi:hypothetical protein